MASERGHSDADADPVLSHQRDDAGWLAETGTRYLAHEMRVGKTPTVIRACDVLGARRVLWITTGTARLSHAYAWRTYSPLSHDYQVVTGGSERVMDKNGVVLTSYDLAGGVLHDRLMKMDFDVIVLDEAHKLKTRTTRRTMAMLGEDCDGSGLVSRAEYTIPMSGTPAPNHPAELWPVLHAVFPSSITRRDKKGPMRYYQFEKRFCKLKYNHFGDFKIVGAKNMRDLRTRMRPHFLRRKFAETYPDAAGIQTETLMVDAQKNLDALEELEREEIMVDFKRRLDRAHDASARASIMKEIDTSLSLRLRRLTGLAKVPGVCDWVRERLSESGTKVVIFGHHSDVLDALSDGLAKFKPLRVSGGVSNKRKMEAEHVFRTDLERRVFLGNLISAGEAIDLSTANDVVVIESSWVPGENDQAIRRVVNLNKRVENIAWFATLADSIDEHIQRTNMRKTADLLELFG